MKRNIVPKLLYALRALKDEIIVVEGQRDKSSLLKLGLKNIFVLHKPKTSFYSRIEALEKLAGKKKCAILTDLDKKGNFLYSAIKRNLTREGIKIDDSLRELLRKAKISHLEGLATYLLKK